MSDSLWPHGLQQARPPCPSPTPGVYSNPCPSSQWCHLTISSSVVPFSSCLQSFPASESFPMSQLFASGGQSIGVSASTSSPSNEHPGLISFRMDWLDLLAVQGTLKNLLQHHSSSGPHKCLTLNSELQITPALNLLSPPSPLPSSLPEQSLSLIPRQTLHIFKAQLKRMLLWQSDSSLSLTPPNKDRQTTLTELAVPCSSGREKNCVVSCIRYSLTPGTSLLISEWMDSEKLYK